MATKPSKLALWYAKFRGSAIFLWGLLGFIGIWLSIFHGLLKFDPDFGIINLILSSEASVSLAFFAMMQEHTDMQHAEVIKSIQALLEANNKVDKEILETVEEIEEHLDGH